jgi:heme exporter protein D
VDPLKASDAGVLAAGFSLALASFVLVYFVLPQRRTALAKRERTAKRQARIKSAVLTPYGEAMQSRVAIKREMSAGQNLPGPM